MEKAIARFFELPYAIANKRVDGLEARLGKQVDKQGVFSPQSLGWP